MKKALTSVLVMFLTTTFSPTLKAQNPDIKRAWHWYFGSFAGIDFSSGTAIADTNGQINTAEGCAAISDINGNLLFYTDGKTIWNRLNQIMPHGTGLLGGFNGSSSQEALIMPTNLKEVSSPL